MIQEEPVKYETARLAADKGFDEICRDFYDPDIIENEIFGDDKLHTNSKFRASDYLKATVCAPNQAHLQRWLREKHKLHCHMYHLSEIDKYGCDVYDVDGGLLTAHLLNELIFETYEKALEDGLLNALKLIK